MPQSQRRRLLLWYSGDTRTQLVAEGPHQDCWRIFSQPILIWCWVCVICKSTLMFVYIQFIQNLYDYPWLVWLIGLECHPVGLWVRSLVRVHMRRQWIYVSLSHQCFSLYLSLSLSLPLSLKAFFKKMYAGEDRKKLHG